MDEKTIAIVHWNKKKWNDANQKKCKIIENNEMFGRNEYAKSV